VTDTRRARTAEEDRPAFLTNERRLLEQAKGAVMLRYGIGSHEALAVLVRWAHAAERDLRVITSTLVLDVCQGDLETKRREPSLARWLEEQLGEALAD
jgi:hypothetical protein